MQYVRWYDSDPDLSHLMKFIETLNEDIRDEIARDLIQIILAELETNKDSDLSQLSELKITNYKRWHDKNISLHSAIEIIKNLAPNHREEIIASIMESVVQILAEYNYESTDT